ncbi:hypothetical protein [Nocardiopsis alba]|uniref:Uncharacterized protein n=1 Tax=Nocardiopsis alba (strain ATCC BAA-2165 / BE74) TaxID=1205910 RepID=J7LE02_NOCAA|nr:hypothetical protein [Nocardiopsis alba]AFR09645.1 hypothetical protein B005_1712 [Nocardiopsis alba ATCC BAA-2165]
MEDAVEAFGIQRFQSLQSSTREMTEIRQCPMQAAEVIGAGVFIFTENGQIRA